MLTKGINGRVFIIFRKKISVKNTSINFPKYLKSVADSLKNKERIECKKTAIHLRRWP